MMTMAAARKRLAPKLTAVINEIRKIKYLIGRTC